jgi:TonB family protein
MSEAWKQCEGQIVDGRFRLDQYLGGSDHSAVFLTARPGDAGTAAIKFVLADPATAGQQLSRWGRTARLSHPHLLKLFDCGQCHLNNLDLLYVVIEYAPEDLSQVLPERALSPAEARDVLAPTLDVLAYLHAEGFVHTRLKPANILAIDDHLKLSSDGISHSGESRLGAADTSGYDAPEAASSSVSPSWDVWSLGATIVEILTQKLPEQTAEANPSVPEGIPALFQDISRNCLQRDQERRWTVVEIAARLNPPPAAEPIPESVETAFGLPEALSPLVVTNRPNSMGKPRLPKEAPQRIPVPPPANAGNGRFIIPGLAIAFVLAAVLFAPRLLSHRSEPQSKTWSGASVASPGASSNSTPAVISKSSNDSGAHKKPGSAATGPSAGPVVSKKPDAQNSLEPASEKERLNHDAAGGVSIGREGISSNGVASSAVAPSSRVAGDQPGEVLNQVLPEVSEKARSTIRGTVRVTVRVDVDSSGAVSGTELAAAGPSRFFSDLALKAAQRWDFAPAKVGTHAVPSTWLVHFEFTPSGTKANSIQSTP